jgi:hypothetical protein
MSRAAAQLPQELWVQILQHVHYKQRLSACALVCCKLARAAAAAATQSLELDLQSSPESFDAFLNWLGLNSSGRSLTRLVLSSNYSHLSICELPCPNLAELQLSMDATSCSVQLSASSRHPGLLHSCTSLTKLSLSNVALLDAATDRPAPAGDRCPPAAAAQLQHLQLAACSARQSCSLRPNKPHTLDDRLLHHLTALTCLEVDFGEHEKSALLRTWFPATISTMVRLQRLQLLETGEEA